MMAHRSRGALGLLWWCVMGLMMTHHVHGVDDPLQPLAERVSANGVLCTSLSVTEARIEVAEKVSFTTRVYEGGLPGPLLRIKAGDQVRIDLHNDLQPLCDATFNEADLPSDFFPLRTLGANSVSAAVASCAARCASCDNEECCPTITNLHTHGLHIDGLGLGDNVHRRCVVGQVCPYEYTLPADHQAGTFWYHAHHHGNTAPQAMGGMAGVIIVDDDRTAAGWSAEMEAMQETVIFMNHMVLLADGTTGGGAVPYPTLADSMEDVLDPNVEWANGATQENFYLVNGMYLPRVSVQPGEVRRLRIAHGGVTHFCELGITGCEMHLLARDGVYLTTSSQRDVLVLGPAARADIALVCPNAGTYTFSCNPNHGAGAADRNNILGTNQRATVDVFTVVVEGDAVTMAVPTTLPPRPSNIGDLQGETICAECSFTVRVGAGGGINGVRLEHDKISHDDATQTHQVSDPSIYLHTMSLNQVQEWTVNPSGANHPLHIHVNHFQLVSCPATGCGDVVTVGEWYDTIPALANGAITIRFLTDRYPGTVVLHCHFVSHEDTGMMALVDILNESGERQAGTFQTQMDQVCAAPSPSPSPSPLPPSPSPSPTPVPPSPSPSPTPPPPSPSPSPLPPSPSPSPLPPSPSPSPLPPSPSPSPTPPPPSPSPSPSPAAAGGRCGEQSSSVAGRCPSFNTGTALQVASEQECFDGCSAVANVACCSYRAGNRRNPAQCRYTTTDTSIGNGRGFTSWLCTPDSGAGSRRRLHSTQEGASSGVSGEEDVHGQHRFTGAGYSVGLAVMAAAAVATVVAVVVRRRSGTVLTTPCNQVDVL